VRRKQCGVDGLTDRRPGSGLSPESPAPRNIERKQHDMNYGIGGILVLILVILAIIYFAKRV
jgi:hypothetical protein